MNNTLQNWTNIDADGYEVTPIRANGIVSKTKKGKDNSCQHRIKSLTENR